MARAIVTGGTKNDADAMAVLALNLKETNPDLADELVIFHDGIAKEKQLLMQQIMPIRFVRYKCPINWFKLKGNKTIRYFSPMVFCKIELFRLLQEYEVVIWTDYDVLIRESITEILDMKEGLSVLTNEDVPLSDMFYKTIYKKNMSNYNLTGKSICAPLIVMNRNIGDYMEYYKWCYECAGKYIKHLYLPEQCIFTMLVQLHDIGYEELDMQVYCMHPDEVRYNTKILHAYGQPKFWNGLHNEEWNRYNNLWKEMCKC